MRHTPWLFSLLQGVGALYLGWLGIGALRAWFARGEQATALPAASAKLAYLGPWLRGLATNLFNPKALVFFLALLSSLVPTDMSIPGKVAAAAILFGLGFAWFALLSVLLTRPAWQARLLRAAPVLDAVCGVVFLLVALGIGVCLLRQV
ncbi:MAG: Threonine efflux protein [Stenotrophomonas maltophilia]|nr:MAG: Threonine efflux protein [Stenotrophomonas maltophilia]